MKKVTAGGRFLAAICALSLAGCTGAKLLPRETNVSSAAFQTYDQIEAAYSAVIPGKTSTSDLSKLGFDPKSANVEVLTYVGVTDRLPHDSRPSGHLPQQVQDCIAAQDRCIAYAFHPEHHESRNVGNPVLELTGFEHKTINSGWSAEVMLLVQDGFVVYKFMSGHPLIEDTQTSTQPLGPLQNLGDRAVGNSSEKD